MNRAEVLNRSWETIASRVDKGKIGALEVLEIGMQELSEEFLSLKGRVYRDDDVSKHYEHFGKLLDYFERTYFQMDFSKYREKYNQMKRIAEGRFEQDSRRIRAEKKPKKTKKEDLEKVWTPPEYPANIFSNLDVARHGGLG